MLSTKSVLPRMTPSRRGRNLPLAERLERLSIPEPMAGCHIWLGSAERYGTLQAQGKTKLAHRVAFECARGPIPDGMCVLHRCDNMLCINPDHLFIGTTAENSADMTSKDRQAKGIRHGMAKLTPDQVKAIRHEVGTQVEIAGRYGVDHRTIGRIKSGDLWRSVA